MKKGENPQLSADWWKKNQPDELPTNAEILKALTQVESGFAKLKEAPSDKVLELLNKVLDGLAATIKKAQGEAEKLVKTPPKKPSFDAEDMSNTIEVFKKFPKVIDEGRKKAENMAAAGEDEPPATGLEKPEVYAGYLKTLLPKLKTKPYNFGLAVGKGPEDARIFFDLVKGGKSLAERAKALLKEPVGVTWGVTSFDKARPAAMLLTLEGPKAPGLKTKSEKMMKALALTTFSKVLLVVGGQEQADQEDDVPVAPKVAAPAAPAAAAPAQAKAPPKPAEDAAKPAPVNMINLTKSRLAWDKARKALQADIEKLITAILAQSEEEPDAAEIADDVEELYEPLEALDAALIEVLDAALNAEDPAARATFHEEARVLVDQYLAYTAETPLMQEFDNNPFVSLSAANTVVKTLNVIQSVLKQPLPAA
ncbi:MAG: hypothetical protein ACKO6N_26005 [Myxococcota bacterium]